MNKIINYILIARTSITQLDGQQKPILSLKKNLLPNISLTAQRGKLHFPFFHVFSAAFGTEEKTCSATDDFLACMVICCRFKLSKNLIGFTL